jgi:hypothetical protein
LDLPVRKINASPPSFIQGITNLSGSAPHPEMGDDGTGPNDRGVRFYYDWACDHVGRWEYPKYFKNKE